MATRQECRSNPWLSSGYRAETGQVTRAPDGPKTHKQNEYTTPTNTTAGHSGTTLALLWYHPIPIDPPKRVVFDKTRLRMTHFLTCPRPRQLQPPTVPGI
jgi:hypothetical protein